MQRITAARLPRAAEPSGWWRLAPDAPAYPAVEGDIDCDFAVVGAGWTGLAAARRLAEFRPDARIVVLEAGRLGGGAAGRNSGFLYDVPFVVGPDAYEGREEDGRLEIALYREVVGELRGLVRERGIACDWSEIGQFHAAAGAEGERELGYLTAALDRLGESYRRLGADELSEALGTGFYRSAIHTPGTVQINPLMLLRGLAAALPDNVALYENAPVVAFETGPPARLATGDGEVGGGTVRAGTVLLTTNAFLGAMAGLKVPLIPVVTLAGLTPPVDAVGGQERGVGGNRRWGVVPAALFGTSLRRLGDGRLLVRNTYAWAGDLRASPRLEKLARTRQIRALRRRFPEAAELAPEWSWGGLVSMFRGANGVFGEVAPGVHAAVTSGMPLCLLYGRELAEAATGGGGPALDFVRRRSQPDGLPPRWALGPTVRAVAALRQRKARAEI